MGYLKRKIVRIYRHIKRQKIHIFSVILFIALLVYALFYYPVPNINTIEIENYLGRKVILKGTVGPIYYPECFPYYFAPVDYILTDSTGQAYISNGPLGLEGNYIVIGIVKVYDGVVGCGTIVDGNPKPPKNTERIFYVQALEIRKTITEEIEIPIWRS